MLAAGCSSGTTSSGGNTGGRVSPTYQGPSETAYCSASVSYSSPITISGTAQYVRREPYSSGATGGLGSSSTSDPSYPATAKPIRYAEVRVTDASGNVSQCAETNASGAFSFTLPNNGSNYTVSINSRADNSYVKASVLGAPESNTFYSLTTSVTATTSTNIGTLTAPANGTTLGAAFHILDRIVDANDYLRAQVGTCSFTGCSSFTVAPKVTAYWEKGYNPNGYFGSSSGLSFYLPSYSRLFILGGVNGDTESSDTDHFDPSVILHEYGHFLEDVVFKTDSPGGSHNGNKVIDPRLAWSEGWGNFFQAAVLYGAAATPYYTDTTGNVDGTTSLIFRTNLETAAIGSDYPNYSGEGNFREFSVTRMLWDAIDSNGDTQFTATDGVSGKFPEIWAALTKSTYGLKDSTFAFRNVGHVHLAQKWLETYNGGSDWTTIRNVERHTASTADYAQYVTTGACAAVSITPATVSGDTGSLSTSDLFRNNDFYHLKISSAGSNTITLEYSDADASGTEADIDLYVYNSTARFGVASDMIGYSRQQPDGSAASSQSETVTASFAAGDYLINVNVYTGGSLGGAVNYSLKLNGSTLCQANLVPP